jgi:hypothetical protein
VRKLAKPSVVAWAVNQVYWHARHTYDRLIKSGERVRKAQIAALEGRSADVRAASDAHRQAIGEAVKEAGRLAQASGSQPSPDALMRTFEAVSIAPEPPEPPGRLTKELRPPGFEALAGVTPVVRDRGGADPRVGPGRAHGSASTKQDAARARQAAAEEKQRAAEEKKRDAAIKKAEAAVERAKQKMFAAQAALKRTRDQSS